MEGEIDIVVEVKILKEKGDEIMREAPVEIGTEGQEAQVEIEVKAKDKIEVKVTGGKGAKVETEVKVLEGPIGRGKVGIMIVKEGQILIEEEEMLQTEERENFQVIEEEKKEIGLHTEMQYYRWDEAGEVLLGMLTEDEKNKNQEIAQAVVTVVVVVILVLLVKMIEGNTGKIHLAQALMNLKVKTKKEEKGERE